MLGKIILLIIPYGGVGGIERLAETFYRQYVSQGYEVKVLKIIRLPNDVVAFGKDEIVLSDHDLSEMWPLRRAWFYLTAPFKVRAVIKRNRVTHSIAFGDVANLFSSITGTGEFKVASIHSLKSVELSSNRTWLARVSSLAYKSLYRVFDRVVSISVNVHDDLISNCGYAFSERLEVIYNPHNVSAIIENGSIQIPDLDIAVFSRPVIMFLGRLSRVKAPWRLVNAFSYLLNEGVCANLVFVGDGDLNVVRQLEAMIVEAGLEERVFFLGRQKNPYQYLARSSVLALTSIYEGTPNVIIESIALGVPVVSAYSSDGIVELMCESGKLDTIGDSIHEVDAGFITPHYPLGDDDEFNQSPLDQVFAEALRTALECPKCRRRLAQAREGLLKKFDVGMVAARYIEEVR